MSQRRRNASLALLACLLLSACIQFIPTARAPQASAGAGAGALAQNARLAGVSPAASIGSLNLSSPDAASALSSFVESCPRLTSRRDNSGLTRASDWTPACRAARRWPAAGAREFFDKYFEAVRIGDGAAFATGYYEPEIAGCRIKMAGCTTPVYAVPDDLIRVWPDDVPNEKRIGRAPLGRRTAAGEIVPYYERAQIEEGALSGRGLEIAYVEDPIAFFFLQIQGSGRIRTRDGQVIRIGYAGQNGREYVGIGSLLRERGVLGGKPGQYPASMQGIMQYLREHEQEGRALMRRNKSWVFFRELKGDGPIGALGVVVRRESSLAADPRFVPLGAPVWLAMDRDEASGLWIAQDTGGAIKGANRFDTFWGAGANARRIAGGMSARGRALVLLPKGSFARLKAR